MTHWTIRRVGFVLGHLENFVERGDDDTELRDQLRAFKPQTDLKTVERLTLADPADPHLPELLLERLAPFFDAGVLIRAGGADWAVTDVFGRGTTFHLAAAERIPAGHVVPDSRPLDVRRAPAVGVLRAIELECLCPAPDAVAYLFRPLPEVCLVLVSRLAPIFAVDHVEAARDLVNAAFSY